MNSLTPILVDNQAIVIPETIDAIWTVTGFASARRSIEATDAALGIGVGLLPFQARCPLPVRSRTECRCLWGSGCTAVHQAVYEDRRHGRGEARNAVFSEMERSTPTHMVFVNACCLGGISLAGSLRVSPAFAIR